MTEQPLKSIDEICKEVDLACDDLSELIRIWQYVRSNGYKYSLVHLRYIREHINGLVREMARRDAKEFKELFWFLGPFK